MRMRRLLLAMTTVAVLAAAALIPVAVFAAPVVRVPAAERLRMTWSRFRGSSRARSGTSAPWTFQHPDRLRVRMEHRPAGRVGRLALRRHGYRSSAEEELGPCCSRARRTRRGSSATAWTGSRQRSTGRPRTLRPSAARDCTGPTWSERSPRACEPTGRRSVERRVAKSFAKHRHHELVHGVDPRLGWIRAARRAADGLARVPDLPLVPRVGGDRRRVSKRPEKPSEPPTDTMKRPSLDGCSRRVTARGSLPEQAGTKLVTGGGLPNLWFGALLLLTRTDVRRARPRVARPVLPARSCSAVRPPRESRQG